MDHGVSITISYYSYDGKRNDGVLCQFSTHPYLGASLGTSFHLINEEEGRDIGSGIGEVMDVDCKSISFDQARFLRICVDMLLDKPIQRGAPVISLEGDKVWVAFQYERLLRLCFNCGLLGDEAKVCKSAGYREGGESPYGDWLRAGFRKPRVTTWHQTPSPPRRNMDEADDSCDRHGRSLPS